MKRKPMKRTELAKQRESLGYNQDQMAEILGVTRRSISRWETGVLPIPPMAEMAVSWIMTQKSKKSLTDAAA